MSDAKLTVENNQLSIKKIFILFYKSQKLLMTYFVLCVRDVLIDK